MGSYLTMCLLLLTGAVLLATGHIQGKDLPKEIRLAYFSIWVPPTSGPAVEFAIQDAMNDGLISDKINVT